LILVLCSVHNLEYLKCLGTVNWLFFVYWTSAFEVDSFYAQVKMRVINLFQRRIGEKIFQMWMNLVEFWPGILQKKIEIVCMKIKVISILQAVNVLIFQMSHFVFFLKKGPLFICQLLMKSCFFLNTCQQQKRSYTTCHFSHENIFCVKQWHVCFIFLWIFKNTKDSNWETIFWTLCNSSETIKSFVDRAKKMNFQSSDVHPISDQVTFKAIERWKNQEWKDFW